MIQSVDKNKTSYVLKTESCVSDFYQFDFIYMTST